MTEDRFREIFRTAHARHPACLRDEWVNTPCPGRSPIVWSRRNGPWQHSEILWVGAAPGNAGGRGSGNMGAHGTRIPFGGDVAGANLEVLFGSIGITRNDTFIVAAYNSLPHAGGGEPTLDELHERVGKYPSSMHLLRDTVEAVAPRLIVALGNVGLRTLIASHENADRLPSLGKLQKAGFARGAVAEWPGLAPILWLTHPSAQNMSPYAGTHTVFHSRMIEARDALRNAVRNVLGWKLPRVRPPRATGGIYDVPEYRELVEPRHAVLDELWRSKGV